MPRVLVMIYWVVAVFIFVYVMCACAKVLYRRHKGFAEQPSRLMPEIIGFLTENGSGFVVLGTFLTATWPLVFIVIALRKIAPFLWLSAAERKMERAAKALGAEQKHMSNATGPR